MPLDVDFTAVYSKRDGIVDWRACVDPEAKAVEVSASHVGMAVDPRVIDRVVEALTRAAGVGDFGSTLEVDSGVGA
jgi:triacylglycerol lipase